jgi:chromosome segregation ATPase
MVVEVSESFNNFNEEIKKLQTNVRESIEAIEPITSKIDALISERDSFKSQTDELKRKFDNLSDQLSNLQKKLNEQKIEFDAKARTNENQIVSLQREIDLLTLDKKKFLEQLKTRDDKISLLESQKDELLTSLRNKSS